MNSSIISSLIILALFFVPETFAGGSGCLPKMRKKNREPNLNTAFLEQFDGPSAGQLWEEMKTPKMHVTSSGGIKPKLKLAHYLCATASQTTNAVKKATMKMRSKSASRIASALTASNTRRGEQKRSKSFGDSSRNLWSPPFANNSSSRRSSNAAPSLSSSRSAKSNASPSLSSRNPSIKTARQNSKRSSNYNYNNIRFAHF